MSAQPLSIINPKRRPSQFQNRQSWYSFYASFSLPFAQEIISSARLGRHALVVDPWNGTGTSTLAAALSCNRVVGFDLNPAMVAIARAKLAEDRDLAVVSEALRLLRGGQACPAVAPVGDPLSVWFLDPAVREIRAVEAGFRRSTSALLGTNGKRDRNSGMPRPLAFFYLALFRIVRTLLEPFLSSNPTWVRSPHGEDERIHFKRGTGAAMFEVVCEQMLSAATLDAASKGFADSEAHLASADSLPLANGSVDFILTSPPYCTRIDYAIATKPELAILGYGGDRLRNLRHTLTGTLTVNGLASPPGADWGQACSHFLKKLRNHPSKASETYYLRTHLQYFGSIARSLSEIQRVMRGGSRCVLVVQDSYYKNVRNDLASIFIEMSQLRGLKLERRQDFHLSRTMSRINPRTRKYRQQHTAVESVLCLLKP